MSDPMSDERLAEIRRDYTDAHVEATRRLNRGWGNPRCPDCARYGWTIGMRDLK